MLWLKVIIYVILFIICFSIAMGITSLIKALVKYYRIKTASIIDQQMTYSSNYSLFVIKLIDNLSEIEVDNHLQSFDILNTNYNVLNLDDDVSEISTKIFNSLKPSTLTIAYNIFTEDYIMHFIVDTVKSKFLTRLKMVQSLRES